MPANCSISNVSCPLSALSIHDSELLYQCLNTSAGFIFAAFTIANLVLLFPLCIFILYLGFKQRKQKGSGSPMSHSDVFTFHMAFIELLCVLGSTLCYVGACAHLIVIISVGLCFFAFNLNARMLFHTLTCMERYLAVVYPTTYLSLRTTKGIRIRKVIVSCVWFLSSFWTAGMFPSSRFNSFAVSYLCFLSFAVVAISLCSLHVLRVLVRQGPGDKSGGRRQLDPSKLKAFYTIMIILGVLLLLFIGNIVSVSVSNSVTKNVLTKCHVWLVVLWLSSPSSLVLPLLFLQRTGKLLCCKNNKEPTQA